MNPPDLDRLLRECSADDASHLRLRLLFDSLARSTPPDSEYTPSPQMLERLRRITSDLLGEHDEDRLLSAIAESARSVLDAPHTEVALKDGDELFVRAVCNPLVDVVGERVGRDSAVMSWLAHDTRQPIVHDDYAAFSGRRSVYDDVPLHAVACIPILAHDDCLGVLLLGRSQPDQPFTSAEVQQGILFAQLVALVLVTESKYAAARRELEEQKRAEALAQRFQQDLKTLNQVNLELAAATTVDALCRRAVELALKRLTIDRIAVFLVDHDHDLLLGTYGTDPDGSVRDEHDYVEALDATHWTRAMDATPLRAGFWQADALYDYGVVVGTGWRAAASLWDGWQSNGYIVCDNYVRHRPARAYETELLSLFGTTLGHLIALKRGHEAQQSSDEHLRAITENIRELVAQVDLTGTTVYVSPSHQEVLGYPPDALLRRQFVDFIHPDDLPGVVALFQEVVAGVDTPLLVEFRVRHADGHYLWMEASGRVARGGDGEINGLISVSRDIHERRQLREVQVEEDRLRLALQKEHELSEMKSRIMLRISHEFRTPLSIILTSTELLDRYYDRLSAERRSAKMADIRRAVERITGILDDILILLRKQSGSMPAHAEVVDLRRMCQQAVAELASHARDRTVDLRLAPITLISDPALLRTVIVSLLSNALKFSPPDQPVIVECEEEAETILLRIIDHGVGIPEAEAADVFKPFYRASNTGEIEGVGLGLSIVQEALEVIGGTISLHSGVGRGTTVEVRLPRASTAIGRHSLRSGLTAPE
ncbi:MAG: PAS domain S-box protein [Anaerolineae bacterium]|nr:PAS domain S-box protein [Anaerolineae bacterium]